jgi:tRNA modification GTPase
MDTIFAVSSGRPPAAIAVLRVSGPGAVAAVMTLAGTLPPPRRAGLRRLRDGEGRVLDEALVLVFPGPASATGEDLVELHCHGGRAVVDAVEAALAATSGVRRAEAGEFTRRALLNGRIDLTQAEGLADLLSAETERQRRAAIDAVEGRLSALVRGWLDEAAVLAARCEAQIDYADEGDVSDAADGLSAIIADAHDLATRIEAVAAAPPVERLRDGIRVVLAGPPNAGKSTLLNRLVEREAAIVTPIAGTTRDRIEAPVSREGVAYLMIDTAGITDTDDVVEAIGVDRAMTAAATADIVLWLGDEAPPMAEAIWVHSRADQSGREALPAGKSIAVVADDLASVNRLWDLVAERGASLLPAEDAVALSQRQIDLCRNAATALAVATSDEVILAEHLRQALSSLARIIGVDAIDTMMDALFARFCVGK